MRQSASAEVRQFQLSAVTAVSLVDMVSALSWSRSSLDGVQPALAEPVESCLRAVPSTRGFRYQLMV